MGRRDQGFIVGLVVLVHDPLEGVLEMPRDLGLALLIQKEKAGHAVHDRFDLRLLSVPDDIFEGLVHSLVDEGDEPDAAGSLGLFDVVLAVFRPNQLTLDPQTALFEIHVGEREAAELADPQTGPQKNDHYVVIAAPASVRLEEGQELFLFLHGQGAALLRVVGDHLRQREREGVFPQDVLFNRHVKGGLHHAADALDRAVPSPVRAELQKPDLGVGGLDRTDPSESEFLVLEDVQHEVVVDLGVVSHALLLGQVLFDQVQHRDLPGEIVKAIVEGPFDLILPGPEILQGGRVDVFALTSDVPVSELIGAVGPLGLAVLQDAATAVLALFKHKFVYLL